MKRLIVLILTTLTLFAYADTEFTVMHGPGGVSDIVSRYLAKQLPHNYIVVNRPGAAGRIAINHMLVEQPDSIMLATATQVFVTNPLAFSDMNPYKDLTIVQPIGIMPSVLVCHEKTGFKTYNDFLKSRDVISFGVGGYGSNEHIATEILTNKAKVSNMIVPYANGGTTAIRDLLGGHIGCMFANLPTVKSQLTQPQLRVLMSTHEIGLNVTTWHSLYKESFPFQSYLVVVAPTKLATEDKLKIKKDFEQSFTNPEFNEGLRNLGLFPATDVTVPKVLYELEQTRRFIVTNNLKVNG